MEVTAKEIAIRLEAVINHNGPLEENSDWNVLFACRKFLNQFEDTSASVTVTNWPFPLPVAQPVQSDAVYAPATVVRLFHR